MHGSQPLPLPSFKYYCKICSKGFGCGRALGGHMRAHGISGEVDARPVVGDDDMVRDQWDVNKPAGKSPIRHMYALRTNPNRLKSCRVCENCGEEFTSWKSFLEHGKCTSDAESLISTDVNTSVIAAAETWTKGRRSERVLPPPKLHNSNSNSSVDEEDMAANCLVMLASGRIDHRPLVGCRNLEETEESSTSVTKNYSATVRTHPPTTISKGLFECKACKKVFNSHQALGGHRASHKKVKGCYAKVDEQEENCLEEDVVTHDEFATNPTLIRTKLFSRPREGGMSAVAQPLKKKSMVHECSICHRTFETGQALGGHKRCHWVTSSSADAMVQVRNHRPRPVIFHGQIDLNLTAPPDERAAGGGVAGESRKAKDRGLMYIEASWLGMSSKLSAEDEVESRITTGKLGDLKDLNFNLGSCSPPWLQVGIGSSSHEG